jgi:hypothetical protein
MSNCVLFSYHDHLAYLGLEPALELDIYESVRATVGVKEGEYTPGSIVAFIYQMMAEVRNLELVIQSRRGTKEFYLQCLDDELQRAIVKVSDFGEEVERVTMTPAIWLLMNRSHAQFVVDGSIHSWDEKIVVEAAFRFRLK